jgi:hypothetical protein
MALNDDEAASLGWSYLSVMRSYRCAACCRALTQAASYPGTPTVDFKDLLPSADRGAIPKATAGSILPPAVKP